jgi:hypothetical protein
MKFVCDCDATIYDITEYISYKAHYITDQDWGVLLDGVDHVIDDVAISKKDAVNKILDFISLVHRSIYQCTYCGRVYLDDVNNQLHGYVPRNEETSKELFWRRPHQCEAAGKAT